MSELMGRNEYARHRGVAPNAVKKAEDDGRIAAAVVRDKDGVFVGINWQLADSLWSRTTDPAQALRSGTLIAPASDDPVETPPPSDRPEVSKDHGYYEARAQRERHTAKLAELEYLQAIGELVAASEVREVSARRARMIRDKLLSLPDRLSSILAAERDPARVHAALGAEIKRVLNELSDDARAELARGPAERVAA